MIVDSHVHVWDPTRATYPWLTDELHPLDRTILLDSFPLQPVKPGIDGLVLIQAADCAEDTAIMREQAALDPRVMGVVAWAPLDRPEHTATLVKDYGRDPIIVGIRNLIHEREPGWLFGPAQTESLALLSTAGLTYDFVSDSFQTLREVPVLTERHPKLRVVIDHLGKPPLGGTAAQRGEWRALIADAADNPNTFAKLSGISGATSARAPASSESIRPFVEDAFDLFGADRLMFGSDWPLVNRTGGYGPVYEAMSLIVDSHGSFDYAQVFSQTALHFYNIWEPRS